MKKSLSIITLLAFWLLLTGCSFDQNVATVSVPQEVSIPAGIQVSLSSWEIQWLVKMREEEKLARDVYMTLWKQWWNQVFLNISSSEQTHTDAVKSLLQSYAIADPVIDDTVGVFVDIKLQQLYDNLVTQWSTSLLNALIVWATVEDLDIFDLNKLIAETTNPNIISVYTNLTNWSHNHLRSFVRNITMNGGMYVPQYISQTEYSSIITSSQTTGNGSAWMGKWNRRQ